MAAPTVTLATPNPARLGNTQFGILSGSVTVSSYDNAHPALTAVTGRFKAGSTKAFPAGVTTSGYAPSWDDTTSSFKLYTTASGGGALTEVSSGSAGGTFDFLAMGHIGL